MNFEEKKETLFYEKQNNLTKIKKIKEYIKINKMIRFMEYALIVTCIFYPIISPVSFSNILGSMEKGIALNIVISLITIRALINVKEQLRIDNTRIKELKERNIQIGEEIEKIKKQSKALENRKMSNIIIEPTIRTNEEEPKLELFEFQGPVRRLSRQKH